MVKIVKNSELIRSFIYDDKEIWERISDDYANKAIKTREDIKIKNNLWVGYFDGEDCKGLAYLKREAIDTMSIHINIPKKYRNYTAYIASKRILDFVEKNIKKQYIKLNTQVPSIYPNIIRWAEFFGFEKYGVEKGSYLKNNKLFDRVLMSKKIARQAWEM